MKKYYINYNTGANNKYVTGTLEETMQEAEKGITYTQEDLDICNEDGKIVARLPWYGVKPDDEDVVTVQFGDFGFYSEWVI